MMINTKRNMILLFILSIILSSVYKDVLSQTTSTISLSTEDSQKFLIHMSEELSVVKSVQSDFIQKNIISSFSEPLISKGEFCFLSPDKLRWEILEPEFSVIIYNKGDVAKYTIADGEIKKSGKKAEAIIKESFAETISWITGDFKQTGEKYEISVLLNSDATIRLTPKNKKIAKHLSSVEIKVSREDYSVRGIIVREPKGDCSEIEFMNVRRDLLKDEELFDPQKPKINTEKISIDK